MIGRTETAVCERVRMADGSVAIVCGGHRRKAPPCRACAAPATVECDVCDVPLCPRCAIHVPPNGDYCTRHRKQAAAAAAQLRLGL
jgi:hypothetical protein